MCSCQRTIEGQAFKIIFTFSAKQVVGVTGFEPVTLRLSSACSNQLSYTPAFALSGFGGQARCRLLPAAGSPAVARSLGCSRHQRRPCLPVTLSSHSERAIERRLVELRRFELLTYSLQSYRSTN